MEEPVWIFFHHLSPYLEWADMWPEFFPQSFLSISVSTTSSYAGVTIAWTIACVG